MGEGGVAFTDAMALPVRPSGLSHVTTVRGGASAFANVSIRKRISVAIVVQIGAVGESAVAAAEGDARLNELRRLDSRPPA